VATGLEIVAAMQQPMIVLKIPPALSFPSEIMKKLEFYKSFFNFTNKQTSLPVKQLSTA